MSKKKHTLEPKWWAAIVWAHIVSEVGCLWPLVALAGVGVSVRVVTVDGDRVVVVDRGSREGGRWSWMVVSVHDMSEWTLNERWKWWWKWKAKMSIFAKSKGMLNFAKMTIFGTHSGLPSWKMSRKMKLKMSRKWPKNANCEQPYYWDKPLCRLLGQSIV